MKPKVIAISGATGFLGQALIPFLLKEYQPKVIRLLGRSEWKLAQILRQYKEDTKVFRQFRPMICDVRDRERVFSCLKDADLVIHTAALKRLEICNYNPQEAIKTNIIGSMNVMDACLNVGVKKAIFISSDKAVNATNLYGRTKAVMESMVIERARMVGNGKPVMCLVRYGNVISSTGAVIPYFKSLVSAGTELPITDMRMTRFLVTKNQALETIKEAIDKGGQGQVIIPKNLKSARIADIGRWLVGRHLRPIQCTDLKTAPFKVIGMWPGEKLHEEIAENRSSEVVNTTEDEFFAMLKEEGLI